MSKLSFKTSVLTSMRSCGVATGALAETGTCEGPAAMLGAAIVADATGKSLAAEDVAAAVALSAVAAVGAGKNVALFPL